MIGLALSGGGSRAMAFHLGCLRALNDLDILDKVKALSTISGGSVIGAYYAYTPQRSFEEFEADIRIFLQKGFQREIILELIKPKNLFPCIGSSLLVQIQKWVGQSKFQRYPSRTDMFNNILKRKVFPGLTMKSLRRNDLEIIIGACELCTGSAFRFSNRKSGSWRYGEMVMGDVDVALAVAASAAFPILLPAFDRIFKFCKKGQESEHRIFLTDGGVYDNLGIQVLEPGRNPAISLHTFSCDYLIACNAGQGQESGEDIPIEFLSRVTKSFEVVHSRVQNSTMQRLHHLKETGVIKGFALPYLGQQDNRLPWKPSTLIPRKEVVDYPTDFAPMTSEWIDKLSGRGEQLTRALVSYYLQDLLV